MALPAPASDAPQRRDGRAFKNKTEQGQAPKFVVTKLEDKVTLSKQQFFSTQEAPVTLRRHRPISPTGGAGCMARGKPL